MTLTPCWMQSRLKLAWYLSPIRIIPPVPSWLPPRYCVFWSGYSPDVLVVLDEAYNEPVRIRVGSGPTCARRGRALPSRRSSTCSPRSVVAGPGPAADPDPAAVLVKGVLHPDDARRAVEMGADGIIVSNHGGRQVDGSVAALDALPGVVGAVARRRAGAMDSGIRSGRRRREGLCLGARAVLIGRPMSTGSRWTVNGGYAMSSTTWCLPDLDITLGLMGCGIPRPISNWTLWSKLPARG